MVDTSAQDDVDNIDEKMKRMITMVGDNIVTPAATASSVTPALIPVSTPLLLLSMVPLFFIAYASWYMELNLESPVLVGMIRTFVQLSILSFILEPIFVRGKDWWWLVIGYTIFMIVLAAYESASRAKYYFRGMFWFVLAVLSGNVVLVSLFAFGIVLQPDPLWEPQYGTSCFYVGFASSFDLSLFCPLEVRRTCLLNPSPSLLPKSHPNRWYATGKLHKWYRAILERYAYFVGRVYQRN